MSRNGSGVYSLPAGSVVANGDTSDATDVNTPIADIAADLNVARPIVAGGTGATSASAARTALGLAIGTNVQAYDAALTSVAALGTAANKGIYFTGVDTAAEFDLTVQGRQLLDDTSFADMRTTLGLGSTATRDIDNTEDLDTNATDVLTRGGVKTAIENYSGWTETTVSTGDGTSFDFTSLPSGITEIELLMDDVHNSAANNFAIRLSESSTFSTSGYTNTYQNSAGGFSSTSGFNIIRGTTEFSGQANLRKKPGTDIWVATVLTGTTFGGGFVDLGGTLDGVQLTRLTSGTLSGSAWLRYR